MLIETHDKEMVDDSVFNRDQSLHLDFLLVTGSAITNSNEVVLTVLLIRPVCVQTKIKFGSCWLSVQVMGR